ncbi:hypothetical protein MuYL_4430 [Mucilaginibacter xinganensis]|uniref:Uncharacterized protein n=2 Tax=Mucilaginibacter xinganensis TaxID=1234841 RepID=A0A223P2H4_9SPHI|nr:hypothetical protein MuYL_4430 [Mucilaginibacter xinganensis]
MMKEILAPLGWRLHSPVAESDALAVDFIKTDTLLSGNIGITFDDLAKRTTFTFYITKSFDEKGIRYFLRDYILKNQEIIFFENRVEELTNLALEKYDAWNNYDIRMHGEKIKLSSYT